MSTEHIDNSQRDDRSTALVNGRGKRFAVQAPAPLLADDTVADREARQAQHNFEVAMTSKMPPLNLDVIKGAACRDADPVLFDAVDEEERAEVGPAVLARRQREAAAICRTCPVRRECLDDARAAGTSGVWGGVFITVNGTEHDLIGLMDAGQLNKKPAGRGRSKTLAAA